MVSCAGRQNPSSLKRKNRELLSAATIAVWVVLFSLATPFPLADVAAQAPAQRASLYQRLGGYDGIASYIALVFPRVAQHPELAHMFRGHGKDSQQRQFQLVVELICQRAGGPCAYLGRSMPPVHDGLGITEAHWATFMNIITTGMDEKKYSPDVRADFLTLWRSFHDDVAQK